MMGEFLVRKVAAIGGGVIGSGWVARFLLNGIDTKVYDPAPKTRETVSEMLANATRAYEKLLPGPLPPRGRLVHASSIDEAVHDAEFIQESVPERLDVKQTILAEIDRNAPIDIPICSSTSGLMPSELQKDLTHPERMLVGHPFNPVYLLPLVEVCGGSRTSTQAIERARAFYRAIGMKPLVLRKEIDAFIADRLLEAYWREALWLVHDGIATVEEIDDAIRYGAGLRWAAMGTFQVYRIAGGDAGMRHFLSQFGPTLKWPWTKLTDVPELSDALVERIAEQSDAQADGLSIRDLERKRDDCLVAILHGLKEQDWGAGATLRDYEGLLADRVRHSGSAAVDGAARTGE